MRQENHLTEIALKLGSQLAILCMWIFCMAVPAAGQDFVYKPKNPAFGGETFNYQWMLSSAQAQDSYKDPNEDNLQNLEKSDVEEFTDNLSRQLLSQLSRDLVNMQFGEDELQEGSYIIGNFGITVLPTLNGISITILDINTGDQTIIEIPFY